MPYYSDVKKPRKISKSSVSDKGVGFYELNFQDRLPAY